MDVDAGFSVPFMSFNETEPNTTNTEGGTEMPDTTSITEGNATLDAAKAEAATAATAAANDPTNAALQEAALKAQQVADAIASLVTAPVVLTPEEQIALAERHRKMEAGLGVVAAITGALFALHQVLTDAKFQELLNKDLPPAVKSAMTKAMGTVLDKLTPLFDGFRKFQDKALREKTDNLFDAAVNIAYALVELAEPAAQESARKSADNIALTMGLVKRGAPLVIACIDMLACCLSALGDNKKSALTPESQALGEKLNKALKAKTAAREADYLKNVEAGLKLIAAQNAKALPAATG